jgi:hypothetical protein
MSWWSGKLREDLCTLAAQYTLSAGVAAYQSRGVAAVTLFPLAADKSSHGNFAPESFAAIKVNPSWRQRLDKPHTRRAKALPPPHDATACELDSCTSSDALLMNVFCYPDVVAGQIAELLGVAPGSRPGFGVPGVVPLADGRTDATELDMQIGDTSVEAKLTESDFTRRPVEHVERYAYLYEVFDADALPRDGDDYLSYQLIRNVLAVARRPTARFVVLLDGRRPDLLHEWWNVHSANREPDLRRRCGFVLWQEIAAAAPAPLRRFLAKKYGL